MRLCVPECAWLFKDQLARTQLAQLTSVLINLGSVQARYTDVSVHALRNQLMTEQDNQIKKLKKKEAEAIISSPNLVMRYFEWVFDDTAPVRDFHRGVAKSLAAAPIEVQKRYEKWKDIVVTSGPQGLRNIKGLRDEVLSGDWAGYRSSRLNLQYRVIYKVERDRVVVQVENVTPHDYRRK